MTAEELLEKYRFEAGEHIGNRDYDKMCEFAKEFAVMHVKSIMDLQECKYYAGETGYIIKKEWEEILKNIK
jgi:hypothetical protein